MKKIILLLCFLSSFIIHAQVTVWSDDFNDEDLSDWTMIDSDGDGINWGDISAVGDGAGGFITPVSLISRSWQTVPLTPDNWAISPAIDLSNATAPITLEYITQVAAASWDEENYSIYVGTVNDINVLINSTTTLTETLGDAGDTGTPTPHAFDISDFAGESEVYIAFRHWDCTDQDFLSIDDVTVKAQTLSVDEFALKNNIHVTCKDKLVTISNLHGKANYNVFSLNGKSIIQGETALETQEINASNLESGIYIVEVTDTTRNATIRKKVVIE